jgi:hypothetical protein
MALTSSGQISLNDINVELGASTKTYAELSRCETGGVATINTASSSYPDGSAPYQISEWYSYDHSASAGFGGIFIDDFHTTGGSDPMDARITYATTGLQDGESFPTDGDSNVVTTRPVWTYNNGDAGTSHVGNDTIRVANAGTHPQWRTTNVPTHSNFSGTINVECRMYMSSGSNKDLTVMIDCKTAGDYWSSANLDEAYFFQFDDGSSRWVRTRKRTASGASTLGQSSNNAFTKGSWFVAKFTWNQSTGDIKVYVDGVLKLSVTDTSYSDFCPSGGGIRFMASRYMSSGAYNEMDWLKVWKS